MKKIMKINPLADRIVLKPVSEEEKTKENMFGIIIPDSKNSRNKEGVVVAVGRGRMAVPTAVDVAGMAANHFAFYPMEVKAGDKVLYTFGDEVVMEGETFVVIKESDILAIIEK